MKMIGVAVFFSCSIFIAFAPADAVPPMVLSDQSDNPEVRCDV
jgi:hypothetical protein